MKSITSNLEEFIVEKNVVIYDAEYTVVAPQLQVKAVNTSDISEHCFAQLDREIDSIMREIGARA